MPGAEGVVDDGQHGVGLTNRRARRNPEQAEVHRAVSVGGRASDRRDGKGAANHARTKSKRVG